MFEENQPQPTETTVEQQGAETPPVVEPVETEAGAETTQTPVETSLETPVVASERTYSQAEWNKRQSALDSQIAGLRRERDDGAMQRQVGDMITKEQTAQASDRKSVEDGLMTSVEAEQRRQQRQLTTTQQLESQKTRATMQTMKAETEQYGRVLASQDFSKQYGLTEEQTAELLKDVNLTTPEAMRAKASDLALERTQGELKKAQKTPQTFDQGQQGSAGEQTEEQSLKKRYPSMYKKS